MRETVIEAAMTAAYTGRCTDAGMSNTYTLIDGERVYLTKDEATEKGRRYRGVNGTATPWWMTAIKEGRVAEVLAWVREQGEGLSTYERDEIIKACDVPTNADLRCPTVKTIPDGMRRAAIKRALRGED